ncbi:hypothetical protein AGMMS49579_26720 [Spirochaetia bacterium]|nr:hypothetical protein AGMMS49579_26720 [Spirochaetia bacterium]
MKINYVILLIVAVAQSAVIRDPITNEVLIDISLKNVKINVRSSICGNSFDSSLTMLIHIFLGNTTGYNYIPFGLGTDNDLNFYSKVVSKHKITFSNDIF